MMKLDLKTLTFIMYTVGALALIVMAWDTNRKLKMLVGDYKTLIEHLKKHTQRLEELEQINHRKAK